VKFRFIREQRETFPVGQLCRVLEVSRSGFYASLKRAPSPRARDNDSLASIIDRIHRENRGVYGSPRVYRALQSIGIAVGKHRVARIMRVEGLRGRAARRFRRISTPRGDFPAAPDLVKRDFTAAAPNRLWVADITQIRTREGWLFLAVIVDVFSRRVVGWSTAARISHDLALQALRNALRARQPAPGLVHHSDRGSQYGGGEYQDLLDRNGIRSSMSRPRNCWDNALAESFFHTIKTEWLYHFTFDSRAQARSYVFDYIEGFYNRSRLHSSLGYCAPIIYETVVSAA
jgi:transposase InsO family protein